MSPEETCLAIEIASIAHKRKRDDDKIPPIDDSLGFPPIHQFSQYISSSLAALTDEEWVLTGKILETMYYPAEKAMFENDSVNKASDGTATGEFEEGNIFL
jgi:hypothetical protein